MKKPSLLFSLDIIKGEGAGEVFTTLAFKFVEFWEGKYHEAQHHLRTLGLIA